MMGRQAGDQSQLFYLFNLEQRIPADHLLRRINPIVARVLADLRATLAPFYSDSDDDDFGLFASGGEAIGEGFESGVVSACAQGCLSTA